MVAKASWLSLEKLQRQHPEVKDPHKLRAMDLFEVAEVDVTEKQRNAGVLVNTAEVYGTTLSTSISMVAQQTQRKNLNSWLPPEFVQIVQKEQAITSSRRV